MNREEAIALFTRVHTALSESLHPCFIWLIYEQQAGLTGARTWHLTIESWGRHWKLMEAQDWEYYKQRHAVLETDEDLEQYADAARTEAESEAAHE